MKKIMKHSILALTIILSGVFVSCELDETQTVATLNNLVMADEFDTDGAPDSSIWTYDLGDGSAVGIPGWGNNELQVYTSNSENVEVQNGLLVITARENGASLFFLSEFIIHFCPFESFVIT